MSQSGPRRGPKTSGSLHDSTDVFPHFRKLIERSHVQGAAFTFDAASYVDFVTTLRVNPFPLSIPFRTFSHATKDPEIAPFAITPRHKIIIIEGLYTLLNVEPWCQATCVMDERIWLECTQEAARMRLVSRHLATGVEQTEEKAMERGEYQRICVVNFLSSS